MNVPGDPNRRHALKMDLHDVGLVAFRKAARKRARTPHTEWASNELAAVRDAVNARIAKRGAGIAVDDEAMMRAERRAYGSSDYAHKLALYVAESAVGLQPAGLAVA